MEEITDELVDIFDRCLAQSYSRAGRELDEFRLTNAKATKSEGAVVARDWTRRT